MFQYSSDDFGQAKQFIMLISSFLFVFVSVAWYALYFSLLPTLVCTMDEVSNFGLDLHCMSYSDLLLRATQARHTRQAGVKRNCRGR